MNSFWLGLASGVPLMIAVGPIAVMLVELGIGRGIRGAWPAAIGVAGADLTFGSVAALCGASLQRALHPYTAVMRWAAAALLFTLAVVMFRRAVDELRGKRFDGGGPAVDGAFRGGTGVRLASRLTVLTLMNPLTIVAFTSLVVATGGRASHPGWPLGIAAASLLVHLGLVALGATLRRALPPLGASWFRVAGSLLIVGLATNLALVR